MDLTGTMETLSIRDQTEESVTNHSSDSYIAPTHSTMLFAAIEPGMIEFSTVRNCLTLIRDTLHQEAQQRSWGTILLYGSKQEEMKPTVVFGFGNTSQLRGVQPSRFPLPILVVTDRAMPAAKIIPESTWINETKEKDQINITDISLGPRKNLKAGGSFGGWWQMGSGQIFGLTCQHTLANGSDIVSPSSIELTARLSAYLPYTSFGLESVGFSQEKDDICRHLLSRYKHFEHRDGAKLKGGKCVALAGDLLGTFSDAEASVISILATHNHRLPYDKRIKILPGNPVSKLDWAIFIPVEARLDPPLFDNIGCLLNESQYRGELP